VSHGALIIDTKLLTLSVTGAASPQYIAKHKRLRPYTEQDFFLLVEMISTAPVTVTPNTLSEVSNWLAYIDQPARSHIFQTFSRLIAEFDEKYIASKGISTTRAFMRLGLTDSVLLELVKSDGTLLTDDFDLYITATGLGHKVINFTHHRAVYL
jgi:hypothetical protein